MRIRMRMSMRSGRQIELMQNRFHTEVIDTLRLTLIISSPPSSPSVDPFSGHNRNLDSLIHEILVWSYRQTKGDKVTGEGNTQLRINHEHIYVATKFVYRSGNITSV